MAIETTPSKFYVDDASQLSINERLERHFNIQNRENIRLWGGPNGGIGCWFLCTNLSECATVNLCFYSSVGKYLQIIEMNLTLKALRIKSNKNAHAMRLLGIRF